MGKGEFQDFSSFLHRPRDNIPNRESFSLLNFSLKNTLISTLFSISRPLGDITEDEDLIDESQVRE
jgi:hypothetical protein